ncbi:unnamed protein product [Rhizophagus irregularis]|uniref:Uncharacterized protein n=1 Tax=Rhizophagus irregularis TaxID=588596 RepID=A0A2I1GJ03_9GLOM|nr:hypothetical protein RhiirA4_420753 [Rhizophagus irregularis]CAB4414031.1 unnamed protein product [Rhizophagus irregularis]
MMEETNKIVQTTAEKSVEISEETIQWYSDIQKSYVEEYLGSFHEIFEEYLLEITKLKTIKAFAEWEKREFGPLTITGSGGTKPERLNIKKEVTEVSSGLYLVVLFVIKWGAEQVKTILERVLRNREDYDRIGQELDDSKSTCDHLETVID